jgi:hydroxyacylglutathione hydrolase
MPPMLSCRPMELRQFVIEGLGHISALVADPSAGVAAVVDPRRDVDIYLEHARTHDVRITHVLETHLHNDYVSGAAELAAVTGATHLIGVGAELRTPHQGVRDEDRVEVGGIRFTAYDTPGHTPEHVVYALADLSRGDDPMGLFTGGSLLIGGVGRTDLLAPETAAPYARRMHASLHERILPHPDHLAVLPTHGGGSLCSKDLSTATWSTLGYERRHDDLLAVEDVEEFVRALLADQPAFPRYFARMRGVNQAGPAPLGSIPEPRPLPVERVRELLGRDHVLVDLRSPAEHAVAHVPGSVSIPAGSSFGTWLGWVVPHDRPLVLLLSSPDDWDDAIRQALRIGYERVEGYLQGGFSAWQGSGGPVSSTGWATVSELGERVRAGDEALVLDVRQAHEFRRAHVPGALHLMAGDVPERLRDLPRDREVAVICASGYRSAIAASLLRQAGFERVTWVSGGVSAWRAAGLPTETGDHRGGVTG